MRYIPFEMNDKVIRKAPNVKSLLSLTRHLASRTQPLTSARQPFGFEELHYAIHLEEKGVKDNDDF